ncbi:hypothetical protein PYJP_01800 [Pyrofollis japonicus]|uniref:hypothetical protein n=1 Tax=Pyrofollis japonicus TaxID=3060460 RepID=UPI00295ABA51|nr:hypothetical protein [Pyrofollis japonicus]BEP16828.1 hypothetical protein PYJP_01800 [Pyrofollis japonicus]
MSDFILYMPANKRDSARILAEKLRKLGFSVEVKEAADTSTPVLVGPFGRVRGEEEVKIILRQLEKASA